MKNKVLVKVYVPTLDDTYEIFLSVNETIKKNLTLILKFINEYSDSGFNIEIDRFLVDVDTLTPYLESQIVRDTNIRNSKLLLLI